MTRKNSSPTRSSYETLKEPRRRRLLNTLCDASIVFAIPMAALYSCLLFVQFSWQLVTAVVLTIMFIPLTLLARTLGRRGKSELGSYILLLSFLVMVTSVAWLIKGLVIASASPFILIIIMAGLLLGPRNSYPIAGLTGVMWLITRLVMDRSPLSPTLLPGPPESTGVDLIVLLSFLLVAVMSQFVANDLRIAVNEATNDLMDTNRRLEQTSKMKSQFTARTSHELRTPLSAIQVITELALRGAYGPLSTLQEDNLRRVLRNTKRLHALIEDILDLSRIEAGQLEIIDEPFAISSLVETVHATLDSAARGKNLEMRVTVSSEMPVEIIGDEQRIAQIVLNLTNNAIKFTDAGEVDVQLGKVDGSKWFIKVRDTGRGIPEADFENIFNEFYQEERSFRGSQQQGTGLGLTVTRHLVELMSGKISVSSQIGKGSTFEVNLPLRLPTSK